MNGTTTLRFPQESYKGFELIRGSEIILEFNPDFIKYSCWSDNIYTDPEDELPKEKHFENINIIDKKSISNISYSWCNVHELYDVCLYNGNEIEVCIKLKDSKQALKLQKQITDWKYKNVIPNE